MPQDCSTLQAVNCTVIEIKLEATSDEEQPVLKSFAAFLCLLKASTNLKLLLSVNILYVSD